jgi:hypothetical protein
MQQYTYRIDSNSVSNHHHICGRWMACGTVCDARSTTCDRMSDLGKDSQSGLSGRIGSCRVRLTTVVEVLSRMLMSRGQGREEGHRQCSEMHFWVGNRFEGCDVDDSKRSPYSAPKQSMLSYSPNNSVQ